MGAKSHRICQKQISPCTPDLSLNKVKGSTQPGDRLQMSLACLSCAMSLSLIHPPFHLSTHPTDISFLLTVHKNVYWVLGDTVVKGALMVKEGGRKKKGTSEQINNFGQRKCIRVLGQIVTG